MLEDLLIGPEGPGMWLDLLSEDSFTTAGSETYGGFAATKYIVDGQVENNRITGTIWIDDQTSALAGADLSIPEDLFFPPASGLSGDVQIVFRVEQADMPVLAVP